MCGGQKDRKENIGVGRKIISEEFLFDRGLM
jgi:hypothetical protein